MSDLTEDFLNEDECDFADVAEADEEALLQNEDEDVLNLVTDEDLGERLDESGTNATETDNTTGGEKCITKRQKVISLNTTKLGNQQGGRGKSFNRQYIRGYGRGNITQGKNKPVLINPGLRGVVHVNKNSWDNAQGIQQRHCPINALPLQCIPPPQQTFVPQPQAMNQYSPIQEDDEQTRELRLKIEEQKKKREEVLRWKQERQLQNLKQRSQDVILEPEAAVLKQEQKISGQQFKMKKRANNIVGTNDYSRTVTKYQKNVQTGNFSSISRTTDEALDAKQDADLELDPKHLSSFLADRKVLIKNDMLMPTRKVVIKNISTSTANKKKIEICAYIGEVQVNNYRIQRTFNCQS